MSLSTLKLTVCQLYSRNNKYWMSNVMLSLTLFNVCPAFRFMCVLCVANLHSVVC